MSLFRRFAFSLLLFPVLSSVPSCCLASLLVIAILVSLLSGYVWIQFILRCSVSFHHLSGSLACLVDCGISAFASLSSYFVEIVTKYEVLL